MNYHGVIGGALKNQKTETEAKSGTLDRELIFLKYGLVCFSKTSGKVGACAFKKQAEQSVQRKGETFFKKQNTFKTMSLGRVILCILFPPLAVLDKGCGSILLVVLLTIAGWVPGVIAALIICKKD